MAKIVQQKITNTKEQYIAV